MKRYVKNEVIQEAREMHTELQILHKGIVKVSGTNTGEKRNILPNTDTTSYFYSKGSFVTYMDSPHTLGLLGYLLQTPSVTTVDSQDDSVELISISFETISQIEQQFGSLSFFMWRPIAMEIGFAVLREEQTYENWSDERLKIHLEEGIFPNLEETDVYDVHTSIDDMVLIQGRIRSKISDAIYVGPAYIPNTVRSFQILDDIESRPRVVMVFLREIKCHASSAMGWLERDEIISIGVCFLHGMKRMSVYNKMQTNENFGQQKSIIRTLGQHLKPKSERILESESL